MSRKGVLAVVSGFSGAGKGTVMQLLMERYDNYSLSVSATTRAPRKGEIDGVHYFFRTREQFEDMIRNDELIEYATYVGNYYGTPKAYVEQQLQMGRDVILEIEIQGALHVKKIYPDALLLFITPPNAEVLKERLVGRGTEDMETIMKRLARASEEANGAYAYDYLVINDSLDKCVEDTNNLIQMQHLRTVNNASLIDKMRKELSIISGQNKE